MRKFFTTNVNTILVSVAVVFLALIVGYFIWGIGYIVTQVGSADTAKLTASEIPSFDLQDAASLNYRGVATSSPPSGL